MVLDRGLRIFKTGGCRTCLFLFYSSLAALLLFTGAVYISAADFTKTEQWTETRTPHGYHAEFAYFHGRKEIPIQLEAGQMLSYRLNWHASGGYGTHLEAKGGTYENDMRGESRIAYRVMAPSTVQIIVTGDRAQGAFTVEWEIADADGY